MKYENDSFPTTIIYRLLLSNTCTTQNMFSKNDLCGTSPADASRGSLRIEGFRRDHDCDAENGRGGFRATFHIMSETSKFGNIGFVSETSCFFETCYFYRFWLIKVHIEVSAFKNDLIL